MVKYLLDADDVLQSGFWTPENRATLPVFVGGTTPLKGVVPVPPTSNTTYFLRADGNWAALPSDLPTAVNNTIIGFDGTGAVVTIAVTGTGSVVLANSPTLITPALGAATATSINTITLTGGTDTFTITKGTASIVVPAGITGTVGDAAFATLDTNTSLTSNDNSHVPTTAAVNAKISATVANVLKLQGAIDCSANPNYPLAVKGDAYRVSVAGKIGGASGPSVNVGDTIVCYADSAAGDHAAVGANWNVEEANIPGLTTTGNNLVTLTNPGAVSFIRINADNTATTRTIAETKTDLGLNNVENTALTSWAGSSSITTLGTIGTGVWQGTAITDTYIASAATWNAKAGLSSPAFTDTPTAPTAAAGTNTTQIATTAFVFAERSAAITVTNHTFGTGTKITLGSDATGDLWYRHSDGTIKRLAIGSTGYVLTVAGGVPSWAAAAGGTTPVSLGGTIAWVSTSSGGDVGGILGRPDAPYLTMAGAVTAGATTLILGPGTFAGLSVAGDISVSILGAGRTQTIITAIESTGLAAVTVVDLGLHSFTVVTLGLPSASLPVAPSDTAGTDNMGLTARNVCATNVYGYGGNGGASSGAGSGGSGGASPTTILDHCIITTLAIAAGNGGAGDGMNAAGSGGSCNWVTITNSVMNDATVRGGAPGADGGGGIGSNSTSNLVMYESSVLNTLDIGTGAGSPDGGSLTGFSLRINNISVGSSGGYIDGEFIRITTITSGTPTINALLSRINGSTY